MTNREAIEVLQRNISGCDYELSEAVTMAISALEKQGAIKSCTPPSDDWEHYADRLHDIAYQSGYEQGKKDAEHDRWTPVSDRLPEKDGDYLVTFEKGFAEDYGLDPIGIAPFEVDCEGFGIWNERFDKMTLGSLGSDWYEIKVTAWMTLPEPYKAEEKDG